jgi:hypothetical protein
MSRTSYGPSSSALLLQRASARAEVEPEFEEVLAALVDLPTSSAGEYDALAANLVNARRTTSAVQEFTDAALSTAEMQEVLALGTPQAVHRLRSRGRVLGLTQGNHTWFPVWQVQGGALRPDLPRILELLSRFTKDVVAADRVMRLRREDLDEQSIAGALDDRRLGPLAWSALSEIAG